MDIQLSSLVLQQNTREIVSLVLTKTPETTGKKLFRSVKHFFRKKSTIYACLVAVSLLIAPSEITFAKENETKTFISTAYYSPLPNQEKYYLGSYEADKQLNGEGITASDGTPVFVGMIAAPKNYAFGTKILLDNIGVVSVHDRGGAIASTNGIDRIDIWMGYGDEGLARTIAWGRRELTGTIVDSNTAVSLNLENITNNAPTPIQAALKKLAALGYDTKNLSQKAVITKFQIDNNIIASEKDEAAGIYGPKTTAKLSQLYNEWFVKNSWKTENLINENLENLVILQINNEKMDENSARELSQNMRVVSLGETAETVKNLQNFLKKMNYFTYESTGIMTLETLRALKKYQFDNDLPQTGRTDIATQQFIRKDLQK